MNRKQFLHQLTGCCAAVASLKAAEGAVTPSATTSANAGTPINDRMAFAQRWTKRLMDNMDKLLDAPTRAALMHANGRTCFEGSQFKPPAVGLDAFIAAVVAHDAADHPSVRRDGDVVYFDYVGNPKTGLKVADGWCLCPLVEKGPDGLSGTYCECSVGYVGAMFERITGQKAQVELLESLKRGGKGCRFKIHLT